MPIEFLSGVVEGFYGQPWTNPQRLELLEQLSRCRLNTYFYAPKDDLKHRALWREPYNEAELDALAEIIAACARQRLNFIYGLSPGLDIRFSDPQELNAIRMRLEQLRQVGARHFALLFDDLPGEMSEVDRQQHASVAAAQCSVTNCVFAWLRDSDSEARLLFCPTPYCDRMADAHLGGADYLDVVGHQLATDIDVLWTGPEIVSEQIPTASIERVAQRIGRPPVIWDNLHANDYDLRRLYCGPYSGRPREMIQHVRGILANPNNEFPINFVPLRTMGMFLDRETAVYEPRQAFFAALDEWLPKFDTARFEITRDDLILLADCYYLPHEQGPCAVELHNLTAHLLQTPTAQWGEDFTAFARLHGKIQRLFENLTELVDRDLFYAWSRRVWELKEEIDLLYEVLTARQRAPDSMAGVPVGSHLPGTYRGGVVAGLQRLLTINDDGSFLPSGPK